MNKNTFFVIIIAIFLFAGCSYVKNRKMAVLSLQELPIFVQDTLRKLPIDKYGCYPDLIDFTNKFHYRSTTIGPWQHSQILTDSINPEVLGSVPTTDTLIIKELRKFPQLLFLGTLGMSII